MRILVIGAGVIGSIYAARLSAAGHHVGLLARGSRRAALDAGCLHLHTKGQHLQAQPQIFASDEVGFPADLIIVAVRAPQLGSVLDLLKVHDSPAVAFLQHLGSHTEDVRALVGTQRTVIAFPGVGGFFRADGSVEYVEITAQPTTIDATADKSAILQTVIHSTGMRSAMERDMPGWLATHEVFVSCLGAGILSRGGEAPKLAADSAQLRIVVQAIHEGFSSLAASGTRVTPKALRVLFCHMPRWFAAAYWRHALRGPVGTVAIAPHTRASRDDEFATLCTGVLNRVRRTDVTPTMTDLLAPWATKGF